MERMVKVAIVVHADAAIVISLLDAILEAAPWPWLLSDRIDLSVAW
jgi:hypothetical protein